MIEFHADDYALFEQQSLRILQCYKNGVLNGISIMPNSNYLTQCIKYLEENKCDVSVSVHLNLVEGKCLSNPEDIDLLVDKDGVFNISFGKLLLASFMPGRKKYMHQIRNELIKQIQMVHKLLDNKPLRLDSHVHYHMVPVVFDAMMEAIEKEKFPVTYIRIPKERIYDYFAVGALYGLKPINIVKTLVLNLLAWRNQRKYKNILGNMEQKTFYGVMHSGNMNYETVHKIIEGCKERIRNGENIEVLFHPGSVIEPEDKAKLTSVDDFHFLTNPLREVEASALIQLKENKII